MAVAAMSGYCIYDASRKVEFQSRKVKETPFPVESSDTTLLKSQGITAFCQEEELLLIRDLESDSNVTTC